MLSYAHLSSSNSIVQDLSPRHPAKHTAFHQRQLRASCTPFDEAESAEKHTPAPSETLALEAPVSEPSTEASLSDGAAGEASTAANEPPSTAKASPVAGVPTLALGMTGIKVHHRAEQTALKPTPRAVDSGLVSPRSTKTRENRKLSLRLTLKEVEASVRICKGKGIAIDETGQAQRVRAALKQVLNPGEKVVQAEAEQKNTEPIREYFRFMLARECCKKMPSILGEDGDRTEWTEDMFDQALGLLGAIEQQCNDALRNM